MQSLFVTRKFYALLFICLCLLIFTRLSAGTREIRFADILITNNAGQILVYARATGCFTTSTEAAILAGVPTTLIFYLDLCQARPYWRDKRLARRIIKHTIKYDNVGKNFHLSSNNGLRESATFPSFENAKRAMAELNGVALYPFRDLAKEKSYYLNMKAKKHDRLHLPPIKLEYWSFFTSLFDFWIGWQKQNIVYRSLTAP